MTSDSSPGKPVPQMNKEIHRMVCRLSGLLERYILAAGLGAIRFEHVCTSRGYELFKLPRSRMRPTRVAE